MKPIIKTIRRALPDLPPPCCPTCGHTQGEDMKRPWVVEVGPGGLTFKVKGSRREVFALNWRAALNEAIRRAQR